MNLNELRDFCENHPENFSIQLKRMFPDEYSKINLNYTGKNFAEKLYKKINKINDPIKCIHCNNDVKFNSFSAGYNKFCSAKCSGLDKRLNSMEDRVCVNCNVSFHVRKSNNKKTCSEACRLGYTKSAEYKNNIKVTQKATLISKYDVDHISKISGHADKVRTTKLIKYGNTNWVNPNKAKETKLNRYGDPNYNNHIKIKETLMTKYGVDNFSKTNLFRKTHFDRVLSRVNEQYLPLFDINDYTGVSDNNYTFQCTKCNSIFEDYLDNGHQPVCRKCYPKKSTSAIEDEIVRYIESVYSGKIIRNSKSIIPPKELDIYLPDLKLAIEINGIYFHTEVSGGKDKHYHVNKTNACKTIGIDLIHIMDAEWESHKDIILGILTTRMNLPLETVYARNTKICDVTYREYSEFVNKNHLQGVAKASIRYGLYYNNELVSVMSFGQGRYDKNSYEMIRYCTKNTVTVLGGFNKLLTTFKRSYPNTRLISYCDRRYFNGDIYTKTGFTLINTTVPGYEYVDANYRLHNRTRFQKHKLKSILKTYDPTLSEWDNMKMSGYDRIWNCGNYKFELLV